MINDKSLKFRDLVNRVSNCSSCNRMTIRPKILGKSNGNINASVMFIAEAPGRMGADRYGIPLIADQSGVNFEQFLSYIGWQRNEVFLTNSILCNPRDEKGNNSSPSLKEIRNCSRYLRDQISLVNPTYVVTLGTKALVALNMIHPHDIELRNDVANAIGWNNRVVIPLYHPGPRAFIHRSVQLQAADYLKLKNYVEEKSNVLEKHTGIRNVKMHALVVYLLNSLESVSRFKLAKLIYLIDWKSFLATGNSITGSRYIRQKFGPLSLDFGDSLTLLHGKLTTSFSGKQVIHELMEKIEIPHTFSDDEIEIIENTMNQYSEKDDKELYTVVYRTFPMKKILKSERGIGKLLLNKTVKFNIDLKNTSLFNIEK